MEPGGGVGGGQDPGHWNATERPGWCAGIVLVGNVRVRGQTADVEAPIILSTNYALSSTHSLE